MPPLSEKGFLGREIEDLIPIVRKAHSDFFSLADEANEYCQKSMYQFDAHNKDKQEVLVATLYIRVLNNYQAAVLLAERGMMPQSRVLARAMIDAVFSLCAISKSEKCADDFIREHQRARLRFLNKYRRLHGGLPPEVDRNEIEALEREIQEDIEDNEIKNKNIEQWAIDAGMHDWYLTAYAVLSDSVHSKVSDLERYLVLDNKDELKEFRWGPDDEDIEKILMTLIQAMLIGLRCTLSLFDQRTPREVDGLQEKLDVLVENMPID